MRQQIKRITGRVSLLPVISNVFEKLMQHQIFAYVENVLSFDTLDHDLLTAKLHAYVFGRSALRFIKSYLSDIMAKGENK